MANWCKGSIRIRGSVDDVKNFFMNHVHCHKGHINDNNEWIDEVDDESKVIHWDDDDEFCIVFKKDAHIDKTRRAFIIADEISFCTGNRKTVVATCWFAQAWDIDAEEFCELSKELNLDFNITGYEKGMQFIRRVTIEHGEIIKEYEVKYQDWDWECDMPFLGG